jgi:hypothetical protein
VAHRSLSCWWWRVIDTGGVQGPKHHFLEEFDIHAIYQVHVGCLSDNLFPIIDDHLPASEVPTQLNRGVMERFLCHITGVDDGSHGQLIANTKINKQTTKS